MDRKDGLTEGLHGGSHPLSKRAVDDSMAFGLGSSSLDETPEKHVGFGNRRMLKKSRSISASNARIHSAMPRLRGPLLPTVRRLNSSPASSKPVTREVGHEELISALRVGMETARPDKINVTIGSSSPTNGDPVLDNSGLEEPRTSTSNPSFSIRRIDERHWSDEETVRGAFDDNMAVLAGGESDSFLSDSSKLNSDSSSQNATGAWKYRSRIETEGNDSFLMRPAKSQRTGADRGTVFDDPKTDEVDKVISPKAQKIGGVSLITTIEGEFPTNQRFPTRFKGISRLPSRPQAAPAAKPTQHPSLATTVSQEKADSKIHEGRAPVLHPSPSSKFLAQITDSKAHDVGPPINVRRRRLPESSDSRHASAFWLNESRRVPQTGTGSAEGVSTLPPSKPYPSKLTSLVRWPLGQSNLFSCRMGTINLLVIVCALSLLYAMTQHKEIILLKEENTKLRAYGIVNCQHFGTPESYKEPQERLGDIDTKFETPSKGWKFLLCLLVLPFCRAFFSKGNIDLPYWIVGKQRDRRITEEEVPISKRVAYLVDVLFSTHSYAKAVALLLATLLLIGFGGFSLHAVSDESLSDALWRSWTYVADSGNHADSIGLGPRIVSVSISIGGMLIFALMLGLVSDAISEKVDSLRKGKSEVIESNHTLILGWSDKLGSLLKQLAIANQSMGGGVVVVLAERDKEEMEVDIAKLEFDFMGTSVICRSGSPLIMADLKKVSVSKARAIIVLAEVENADQSDARALRVVLSLTAVKEGLRGHIVVELSDLDNEPLVKLVGQEMVETVVAHDVIGRLMIQCARQPGLAQIWEDILGFDHAEFYLKRWPQLDGMRFEDVLISFPEAIPCGLKVAAEKGRIILNPDDDHILREGDEILVIAEDDDTYSPAPPSQIRRGSLPKVILPPKLPERILFCGWRRDIHDMIKVLDAFLPCNSELWIFSDVAKADREKKLLDNLEPLANIRLVHREGNPVIRRNLESLPLQIFDSILILADEKLEENVVIADSRSLATLLLIRDIQSKRLPLNVSKMTQIRKSGFTHSSWIGEMRQASDKSIIISEILDSRTKHLVSVTQIGDYVLSNELVSMALAMVAEEKQINRVLEELFAEEGNELYIRSAEFYLYDQEEVTFFEIMIRARQRQEIVIGYRRASQERAIINPPNKAALQIWSIEDVFVVLAWEE